MAGRRSALQQRRTPVGVRVTVRDARRGGEDPGPGVHDVLGQQVAFGQLSVEQGAEELQALIERLAVK